MNWSSWVLLGLLALMFIGAIRLGMRQARGMEESVLVALRMAVTPLGDNTCRVCGHVSSTNGQCSHCGDLGDQ